ncbi:MAG: TetR family transcriptional regulator [Actinomycetota bacterium]
MTFSAVGPTARADAMGSELDTRGDRFVVAARALANETGSAAFTVHQVARRAGLSLKSFYRCFPAKDDLLLALLADDSRAGAAVLRDRIGDRYRRPDGVRTYVTELFDMLTLPGAMGYAGVLVREHRRLVEHRYEAQRVALAPLTDLLAPLLDTDDSARDAETIFGVLVEGVHQLVTGRADDAHALGEYLARFCTQGVDAP